jgi:hypothetical protein
MSQGEDAWAIRCAHKPKDDEGPQDETYSKVNLHPVLKMLKSEGYK